MEIKIERIEDLFDEDIVNEMLSFVEEKGCCHFNSAMVCVNFDDWKCIDYVEGYLGGYMGHAINSYRDAFGNYHYFDITQEYNIRNKISDKFDTKFEIVKTFSTEEINEIFQKDGVSHLVTVDYVLKDKAPQYMKDHWDYFLSLVEDEWGTAEIENTMKQCVN